MGFAKSSNMTEVSGGSKVGLTQVSQGTMTSSSGGEGEGNRMGSWDVEKGGHADQIEGFPALRGHGGEGQRRQEQQSIGVGSWA